MGHAGSCPIFILIFFPFFRIITLVYKNLLMMKRFLLYCLVISITITISSPAFSSMIAPATRTATDPDPATVKAALAEFKNLSKKERKLRVNEAKKELKHLKKENKENRSSKVDKTLLIVLSFLLPPLAVYLYEDDINTKFWISVGLTLLFWIPGIIYALLIVTDSL
jgi:uncharacterized membrane protein YqaE (UPF0057 family)